MENADGGRGKGRVSSADENRRERTERQRQRRLSESICGWCEDQEVYRRVDWKGRGRPLQISICIGCLARLEGRWSYIDGSGLYCPLDWPRPCQDCDMSALRHGQQPGWLRWLTTMWRRLWA